MLSWKWFIVTAFQVLMIHSILPQSAGSDPVPLLLTQFSSNDQVTRSGAFYSLLALNPNMGSTSDPTSIATCVKWLLTEFPSDVASINSNLIALLSAETLVRNASLNAYLQGKGNGEDEGVTEYYAALLSAVAALENPGSIDALLVNLDTGDIANSAIASLGPITIDKTVAKLSDLNPQISSGAVFTLARMLSPDFYSLFADPVSKQKIATGLAKALSIQTDPFMQQQIHKTIATVTYLISDINGDGQVDCADLGIAKSSFGKRAGQSGFDVRADLDVNGIVDIRDLATVARNLPAGTKCPLI
jgi:hypothetical protein